MISPLSVLFHRELFSYIDFALARELLKNCPSPHDSLLAFLIYLSRTSRAGHLCIEIIDREITPPIEIIWSGSENDYCGEPIDEELYSSLKALLLQGAEELPPSLLTDIAIDERSSNAVATPLCRSGNKYYFQRNWYYETLFIKNFERVCTHSPGIDLDDEVIAALLEKMQNEQKLLPEQAKAIAAGCKNTLTIICGGPGTGKTYTAGQLIATIWQGLSAKKKERFQIALAAPTGKAAANLQNSLRMGAQIEEQPKLKASTLHSLLAPSLKKERYSSPAWLAADIVIVDEASMIDAKLMASLFAAMKPGGRLILLGDEQQLPAVEAGSLFADLVAFAESRRLPILKKLNSCLRAELQSIIDFSTAINSGEVEQLRPFTSDRAGDRSAKWLHIDSCHSPNKLSDALVETALPYYRCRHPASLSPQALLKHFESFRLLSPLRKGPLGCELLNKKILDALLIEEDNLFPFAAPIMITKNCPSLQLFNGEIGILFKVGSRRENGFAEFVQGDYALFPTRGDEKTARQLPALLLPPFEYAYCISVHKSQGSEFQRVLLLLPPGAEHFGKEMLYTGVTRARQSIELWCNAEVLSRCLARNNRRLSAFAERQMATF